MENKKKTKRGLAIAGLAAATIAAGYFLYGPKGAENRKKLRGWSIKMKGEVLEKVEKLKEVNKENYEKIVDQVTEKYKKIKEISQEEVEALSKKLKSYWTKIEKSKKK